jgi:glycine cleavage system protein P-like pyridoxal-binding family
MKITRKVISKKHPIIVKMTEEEYQILSKMAAYDISIPNVMGIYDEECEEIQKFLHQVINHNNAENARAKLP